VTCDQARFFVRHPPRKLTPTKNGPSETCRRSTASGTGLTASLKNWIVTEDNDFLELCDLDDSDEIADLDSDGQLGMTDLRFKCWFEPFGSGVDRGVPHPIVLDSDP
jgi:hypothetical protein